MVRNLTKNFFALMEYRWPLALAAVAGLLLLNLAPFVGVLIAPGWSRVGYALALACITAMYVGMGRYSPISPFYFFCTLRRLPDRLQHPAFDLRHSLARRCGVAGNQVSPESVTAGHGLRRRISFRRRPRDVAMTATKPGFLSQVTHGDAGFSHHHDRASHQAHDSEGSSSDSRQSSSAKDELFAVEGGHAANDGNQGCGGESSQGSVERSQRLQQELCPNLQLSSCAVQA